MKRKMLKLVSVLFLCVVVVSPALSAGVNYSRYLSQSVFGYWVNDASHPWGGYWVEDYATIVSAEEAVDVLEAEEISQVKVFAPGRTPANEFAWKSAMWRDDMTAMAASSQSIELFLGIPNSALLEIAGIDFRIEHNGVTFTYPSDAYYAGCDLNLIKQTIAEAARNNNANDLSGVKGWMQEFIEPYLQGNLKITFAGVGNEPFGEWNHGLYNDIMMIALKKTQAYLNEKAPGAVVTVPFAGTFFLSASKVEPILEFLNSIGSIFMQNIYPHSDTFNTCINHVVDSNKSFGFANYKTDKNDALVLKESHLVFIKDFIAWSVGEPTVEIPFPTESFYEAYINGYKEAMSGKWGNRDAEMSDWIYDLPVVAGETGWPTSNDVVYNEEYINATFNDLEFDDAGTTIVTLSQLRQIVSNEMFNTEVAGKYTQSVVKYLRANNENAYFFELIDEANKHNEAEGMIFELEPHFGLYHINKNADGNYSIDSEILPKFDMDLRN